MAQRPRISQLKRNDVNYRTFKEQFEELEGNTSHLRPPVRTKGELPFDDNVDGSQCLVVDEGVVYYWDSELQNWQPTLGQVFRTESATFKRWKKTFTAIEGQTDFFTGVLFAVGQSEIDVYVQGLLQDVDVDYIEFDERTIRFLEPVPAGAQVTLATPMMVESTTSVETYLKRLEDLEFNNYQLMLTQYYDGKNFEAQGIVFDGFINTKYVDYALTTPNVLYDAVHKSMYMFHTAESGIVEHFDSNSNIDTSSTVYLRGSEITLPISSAYKIAFIDDFSTQAWMDLDKSNVFWDREKKIVTNNDTYGGGDHYYKGDFMTTTENVDSVGFSEGISKRYEYYWGSTESITSHTNCFSVLAMGNLTAIVNDRAIVYRNVWPYSSYSYFYRANDTDAYRTIAQPTSYPVAVNVFGTNDTIPRPAMTYIRKRNRMFFLYQYSESSGRYYQRLYSATGRTNNFGSWTAEGRPNGLPNTMFGSQVNTYTQSSSYISQIGSTYEHLLLRSENKLYFLNETNTVVKTLDWSNSDRKPSTYNVVSQQITADKRYLYFPARLLRDGYWGYYLEVFNIEDGSFVGEILVTRTNSGNPGTTAMGFDHDYNRIVLGQQGGMRYTLHGKSKNSISDGTSYAGMLIFEAPDERMREVISKPMKTNLPVVHYQLKATSTLNSGIIDYYIRFNQEAWTKILPLQMYTWNNPNGAKETIIQLRATLKTTLTASKAPELTEWALYLRHYEGNAKYRSKPTLINMDGVTGGSLSPTQDVPNETSLSWFIELDNNSNRHSAGQDGIFTFKPMTGDAYFTMEANMNTNNPLMSPVVYDVSMQMYRDDEGILYTETSPQLHDIRETSIWVTTSSGNSNYEVDVSRDGGATWFEAVKRQSIQVTNGNVETNWYHDFDGIGNGERDFKIRFRINGSTEILQYGAKIN